MRDRQTIDLFEHTPVLEAHVGGVLVCQRRGSHCWADSITVFPGESSERLTKTCRDCGEIRGRA